MAKKIKPVEMVERGAQQRAASNRRWARPGAREALSRALKAAHAAIKAEQAGNPDKGRAS
jgi:hypothetical protein